MIGARILAGGSSLTTAQIASTERTDVGEYEVTFVAGVDALRCVFSVTPIATGSPFSAVIGFRGNSSIQIRTFNDNTAAAASTDFFLSGFCGL